jgi:N-acetylglucosaminyldiphosphoundecaprenol N-acetyl-beta-D-mannosaminyltransferase
MTDPVDDANPNLTDYSVAGCRINAVTADEWVGIVAGAIATRERRILVGQNLHSAYLLQRDASLRRLQEMATVVRIDGLPLVFFARVLGYPVGRRHRSGFMDLIDPLLSRASEEGWAVFYLGSRPAVAEEAIHTLRARYPGVTFAWEHGYFDPHDEDDNARVIDAVNASEADLLIVGMGMPRQERWMLENHEELRPPAIVASGAAMDFVAGATPSSPRWLSRLGLEWLVRLANEPRRLTFRYLVEPWFVLAAFSRQLARRVFTGRREGG